MEWQADMGTRDVDQNSTMDPVNGMLERERVDGPLPKTQMDSSRKTNPYLFFPSL